MTCRVGIDLRTFYDVVYLFWLEWYVVDLEVL